MTEDVAIVGAGPNGLMLACELSLAGVRPLVLERLPERSAEPKANGLVGQVVRFLDHRGLYEPLGGGPDAPRPAPFFTFGGFPLPLGEIAANPLCTLPVPQRRVEQLLEERARAAGVEIRRGHEVTGLSQDEDGVTVAVQGPDSDGYRMHARYLVGCDGGHSTVRSLAGIAFPGVTGPDLVSRTAHVTLPADMVVRETGELDVPGYGRIPPFTHTRTEHGVLVFAAMHGGPPLLSTIEWGSAPEDEDAPLTLEEMRASAQRVLGADLPLGPPPEDGPRMLRRRVGRTTRLAERYRQGRVLLAGDAAHVHSAVGGPGLNLGLQDVANLGWKLAAQLRGRAPEGLLETYHSERHAVGRRVFMHTQAQTALMSPGPEVTALRELFGELLQSRENLRHVADLMAGADTRYDVSCRHSLAGAFVPDLQLAGTARLAELLRTGRPLLLDLGAGSAVTGVAGGWKEEVDVVPARCAETPVSALLIRPDGHVAWATEPDEAAGTAREGLRNALTNWFGHPADS